MKNISISGKLLAIYREKAGLSQEDLAKTLGVARTTVTIWERKEPIKISEKQEKVINKALNVTTDLLSVSAPTEQPKADIMDHPVIKSLVAQSEYLMKRIAELEDENKKLRSRKT